MKKQKNTGKGYITTKKSGFKAVYDYMWSLTDFLLASVEKPDRKLYHRFICHIYVSMVAINRKQIKDPAKDNSVPIYCRLKDHHFGKNFKWRLLRDAEIIKVKPHNSITGKSREYKLADDIFNKALKITENSIINILYSRNTNLVNLFTGQEVSPVSSQLYMMVNGNQDFNIPDIIKSSIKSFEPCPLDIERAVKWFKRIKKKYNYETVKFKKKTRNMPKKSNKYIELRKSYKSHKGKYINELSCLEAIISQATKTDYVTKKGNTVYLVNTPYKTQKSGRLTEIHGGFQSISTMTKHLLLRDMPFYNYDLTNSQAFILLDEMGKYDIKCPWLENYLKNPRGKEAYANRVKLPVGTWKSCFFAIVMGANAEKKSSSIYATIRNHCKNEKRTDYSYNLLLKEAKGLIKPTNKWRNALFYDPMPEHHSVRKGTLHWKNACNMFMRDYYKKTRLSPYDILILSKTGETVENKEKCKRKIASHILQGREAYFIHYLTNLCSKEGITIYKNEHDGLISLSEIPKPLILKVKEHTGLHHTDLVQKELCSPKKRNKWLKYVRER